MGLADQSIVPSAPDPMTSGPKILRVLLIAMLLLGSGVKAVAWLPQTDQATDVVCVLELANNAELHGPPTDTAADTVIEDVSDADDFIAGERAAAAGTGMDLLGTGYRDLQPQSAPTVPLPPPNVG